MDNGPSCMSRANFYMGASIWTRKHLMMRSGRPVDVSTPEAVQAVEDLIKSDRRVTLDEIATNLDILMYAIVRENVKTQFCNEKSFYREFVRPAEPEEINGVEASFLFSSISATNIQELKQVKKGHQEVLETYETSRHLNIYHGTEQVKYHDLVIKSPKV